MVVSFLFISLYSPFFFSPSPSLPRDKITEMETFADMHVHSYTRIFAADSIHRKNKGSGRFLCRFHRFRFHSAVQILVAIPPTKTEEVIRFRSMKKKDKRRRRKRKWRMIPIANFCAQKRRSKYILWSIKDHAEYRRTDCGEAGSAAFRNQRVRVGRSCNMALGKKWKKWNSVQRSTWTDITNHFLIG